MRDKVGTSDQISFILNGKSIDNFELRCPKCGVDRSKVVCPNHGKGLDSCPMTGVSQLAAK